ncbi:hypothetical protein GQ53DRAFT_175987 [Thozetella sp. PMI_491]|nr:hypothetical protein GQ53DRAFT_175987 [Thozetella sp. PMI_491]
MAMFAHILQDPTCQSVFSPQAACTFFPFIPSRLGRNAALDAAILCLCDIYSDVRGGKQISPATTKKYIVCLSTLRASVADPELRTQSETLCASLIVQTCELMLDPGTRTYNALLTGSRSLIQDAGPERFHSGFDRAMLELQRAPFIAQDLATEGQCFLSDPEWRALPQHPLYSLDTPSLGIRLRTQLSDFLVDVPALTSAARLLLSTPGLESDAGLSRLTSRVRELIHRIEMWYEHQVYPHVRPKTRHGIDEDLSDREYPELLFSFLDCVICAVLVKLDDLAESLSRLQNPDAVSSTSLSERPGICNLYTARVVVARLARQLVESQSAVTAKQLCFGLRRLGFAISPKST